MAKQRRYQHTAEGKVMLQLAKRRLRRILREIMDHNAELDRFRELGYEVDCPIVGGGPVYLQKWPVPLLTLSANQVVDVWDDTLFDDFLEQGPDLDPKSIKRRAREDADRAIFDRAILASEPPKSLASIELAESA
jgi:hypothetical protein